MLWHLVLGRREGAVPETESVTCKKTTIVVQELVFEVGELRTEVMHTAVEFPNPLGWSTD